VTVTGLLASSNFGGLPAVVFFVFLVAMTFSTLKLIIFYNILCRKSSQVYYTPLANAFRGFVKER
jgi:hypothetical protein